MSKKFIYNGTAYRSLRSFCNEHGWSYQTFCRLYKKTGSITEAVARLNKKKYPYFYMGKHYRSLAELCKDHHTDYNRFHYYYYQKHESIEAAIADSKHAKRPSRRIQYQGVCYASLLSFCKENDLPYTIMRKNLESMPLDEAVEKTKKAACRQKSIRYKSYVELCEKNFISYWSFMAARQRGLSVEDSIAYCQKSKRKR